LDDDCDGDLDGYDIECQDSVGWAPASSAEAASLGPVPQRSPSTSRMSNAFLLILLPLVLIGVGRRLTGKRQSKLS
jgi:hypothetical protein